MRRAKKRSEKTTQQLECNRATKASTLFALAFMRLLSLYPLLLAHRLFVLLSCEAIAVQSQSCLFSFAGGESAVLASAPRADVLGLSSERMVEPSSPPLTETPSHNQEPGSLSTQNRGANGPTGIVPLVPPLSLPMVGSEQSAGREGSEQITPVAMATAVTTRPGSEPSTLLSRLPRPALTPTLSLAPVPSLPYLPPPTVSPQDDELRPSLLSSGASLPRRGRTEFNEDGRFSAPSGFDESTSTSVSEAPPEAASVYDEERASSTTGERLATIEEELGIPAMSTVESGRNTTPPIGREECLFSVSIVDLLVVLFFCYLPYLSSFSICCSWLFTPGPDFVLPPERPPLVDRWRRRERLSFGSPEVVVITPGMNRTHVLSR